MDNHDVLFKDSLYTAIGLAADILSDKLDFNAFLMSTLGREARMLGHGYNVLRRRIAIVLSQWITVGISAENKPLAYQIFAHLFNKNDAQNDVVVRVSAGRYFKSVVDEWEFKADDFLPYASDVLDRLMDLVAEVELPETKMALLNTVTSIVGQLEHHVSSLVA